MGRKPLNNQVKLQVNLQHDVHQGLQNRAQDLGFDTLSAYVRFWAKAETSSPAAGTAYQDLSKPDVRALRYVELLLAGRKDPFESTQQAIDYIAKELGRAKMSRYLIQVFSDKPS